MQLTCRKSVQRRTQDAWKKRTICTVCNLHCLVRRAIQTIADQPAKKRVDCKDESKHDTYKQNPHSHSVSRSEISVNCVSGAFLNIHLTSRVFKTCKKYDTLLRNNFNNDKQRNIYALVKIKKKKICNKHRW